MIASTRASTCTGMRLKPARVTAALAVATAIVAGAACRDGDRPTGPGDRPASVLSPPFGASAAKGGGSRTPSYSIRAFGTIIGLPSAGGPPVISTSSMNLVSAARLQAGHYCITVPDDVTIQGAMVTARRTGYVLHALSSSCGGSPHVLTVQLVDNNGALADGTFDLIIF